MTSPVPLPPSFLRRPIAHRALHDRERGRPENSRSAVKAALEAGYPIEIDLQISSDGQAMVFHDDTLDRLTGEEGPVNARTATELSSMRLLDSEDGIPTLSDILALVRGRVPLLIEFKDQTGSMSVTDGRLEAAAISALRGYQGPVAFMSFNPHAVAELARLSPAIPRGLVTSSYRPADWAELTPATCERLRQIPDYDRTGATFISHEASDLARPRVAELKSKGAAILCWTIRSPAAEAMARKVAQNVTFEGYLPPAV